MRYSIGDKVHIWDSANIVADIDGSNVSVYIRGINLLYADDGDKTYYHFNAHGDVVALTNESGNKTKSYSYNAFGVEYNEATLDDNPFRYCGEYYDKETKTIYLRARYYNAEQGRFTQEDPIRDGYNWYAYCENNPVIFIDLSGLAPEFFQKIGGFFEDVGKTITNAGKSITELGAQVIDVIEELGSNMLKVGSDFVEDLSEVGKEAFERGSELIENVSEVISDAKTIVKDVKDIVVDNITIEAGLCIGVGASLSTFVNSSVFDIGFMQRADFIGFRLKDGELEFGQLGYSGWSCSLGTLSFGQESRTVNGKKENPDGMEWFFDIAIGDSKALAYIIGGHSEVSMSILGIIQDGIDYFMKGW